MTARSTTRVLVAGSGIAAVETMLALRALARERVTIELVAPDAPDLADVAARAGASRRRDTVAAVAGAERAVRLRSGARVRYDALVLALGARPREAIPGALTFRGRRDAHLVRETLGLLRAGAIRRVVFAAPLGVTRTPPLYELALLTARSVVREELDAEVALVTPERRPLEAFGRAASDVVAGALARAGVRLVCDARPRAAGREGLTFHYGGVFPADRVIAVPALAAPELPGVPTDWNGFVVTDADGRVPELAGVYAAGDLTTDPVRHGGLAAQQGRAVAAAIAAEAGAVVPGARPPRARGCPQPVCGAQRRARVL